jgi:3-hydroxyisobutyrate dehydrogenase-like beta-hydroxyacid dehydrogenase
MRKDLKIALEEAKKNNSPLPITKIIDGYYEEIQKWVEIDGTPQA